MRDPRRHPSECFCRECTARRSAQRQISFAEKLAAERARGATPLEAKVNSRREKRRLDGLAAIAADVAATDVKLERWRRDRERVETDRRSARFLQLKREGRTSEEAHDIIEREITDATIEEDDEADGAGPLDRDDDDRR